MRKFMISEEKKEKGSRRKPCRNFHNVKRKLHWNVYAALAESFRRYNSSRFTLPFARLSLTILYAWSNSPFSPSNFQNESANSRNQIFRCVTHLTDGLPRSLAKIFFLFLRPALSRSCDYPLWESSGQGKLTVLTPMVRKVRRELFRRLYFRRKFSSRGQVPARDGHGFPDTDKCARSRGDIAGTS